jgi:hypothetical protein
MALLVGSRLIRWGRPILPPALWWGGVFLMNVLPIELSSLLTNAQRPRCCRHASSSTLLPQ